eukprot:SAG31_NODE_26270_length_445_cov_1.046243_1_plen_129_part_00
MFHEVPLRTSEGLSFHQVRFAGERSAVSDGHHYGNIRLDFLEKMKKQESHATQRTNIAKGLDTARRKRMTVDFGSCMAADGVLVPISQDNCFHIYILLKILLGAPRRVHVYIFVHSCTSKFRSKFRST